MRDIMKRLEGERDKLIKTVIVDEKDGQTAE